MVNPGLAISLFDFQEQAVIKLLDLTSKPGGKQTIVMKSPTGSGKTIILIDYVDKYLSNVSASTAFIWLCPGKGNLEELAFPLILRLPISHRLVPLAVAGISGIKM